MKVLFDTSALVPAIIVNHPQHSVCFTKIQSAKSGQIQGFISTHSLAETYSVITRLPVQPRISPQQAQSIVVDILQYLEGVPLVVQDYQNAIAQMATLNLPGGAIFDALIAQAALKAQVDILLTLNPNHFTRLGSAIASIVQVPT
ncbi:PIN domain-containing protein [Aulosira sp. FACHB-615]|uniref:type II toxin-antitoxin system VapC family toxin n=1 Tax=Aulosira sp. FACHB-615 TaxID=2692777 RepID=UPI001682C50E|nr:PIN domain-containing protein [Aulosira sp. FACHB-615]MBD2491522.1 PIN domain-containing protein [Aulosira sp. FACHB-615]